MVGREQIEVARDHANLQSGLLHLRLGLRQGCGRVVRVDRMAGPHCQVIAIVTVPLRQFDQFGNTLFLEHLAENDQFHVSLSPFSIFLWKLSAMSLICLDHAFYFVSGQPTQRFLWRTAGFSFCHRYSLSCYNA